MTKETAMGDNSRPLITPDQLARDHAALVKEVDEMMARAEKLPENITGEEAATLFANFVIESTALLAKVDKVREGEKAPYLAATKAVDGFFNAGQRDRLSPFTKRVRTAHEIWLWEESEKKRKELEAERDRLAKEAADKAEAAAAAEGEGKMRVADVLMEGAVATEQAATGMAIKAEASTLDLSRTTTGAGTASVSAKKAVTGFNRATVDLEALRAYLGSDAIEKALKAALAVGVEVKGAEYGPAIRGNYRAK